MSQMLMTGKPEVPPYPGTPLPIPRIEVSQYNGYNGGFAVQRKLLYRCDIIGVNGTREHVGGMHGHTDAQYAERDAALGQERTGWPIFNLGRQEARDDPPRG